MEPSRITRNVRFREGLSFSSLGSNDATYSFDGGDINLHCFGQSLKVDQRLLSNRLAIRGTVVNNSHSTIYNLIFDSIAPLNMAYLSTETCVLLAAKFLSAFTSDAVWTIDIGNREPDIKAFDYLNPWDTSPSTMSPASVFLRWRFPTLYFQFQIVSSLSELGHENADLSITTLWSARLKEENNTDFESSPIVAYGTINDTLAIDVQGKAQISMRNFRVENIVNPKLFRIQALPLQGSQAQSNNKITLAVILCSIYKSFDLYLRGISQSIPMILGFAALTASLQPIVVTQVSPLLAAFLGGIGSSCAMLVVFATMYVNVSGVIASRLAKRRLVDCPNAEVVVLPDVEEMVMGTVEGPSITGIDTAASLL